MFDYSFTVSRHTWCIRRLQNYVWKDLCQAFEYPVHRNLCILLTRIHVCYKSALYYLSLPGDVPLQVVLAILLKLMLFFVSRYGHSTISAKQTV